MKIINQKRGYPRLDAKTQRQVEKLRKRSSELTSALIKDGLGAMRFSELREHQDNPHVVELLVVDGELQGIFAEYERQTGVRAYLGIF